MNKIIDGKKMSLVIKENLKKELEILSIKPSLAVIQVGDHPASNIYVNHKKRVALEIGIKFLYFKFTEDVTMDIVLEKITELNNDKTVDGIFIQLPIPNHLNSRLLIDAIDYNKDVDGLTVTNTGLLFTDNDGIVPCTPLGIMTLLKNYNISLFGKNVVIIGRSNLVGKPLISLLLKENATVTICHSHTEYLSTFTKKADILIVAVGQKDLINSKMIKKNVIIIDVGINKVDDKIYGDVDYNDVFDKVKMITPVPGGVGPMTVIMLMKNVVEAHKKRNTSK